MCIGTLVSLAKGGLPLNMPRSNCVLLWGRWLVDSRKTDTVEALYSGHESENATSQPEW